MTKLVMLQCRRSWRARANSFLPWACMQTGKKVGIECDACVRAGNVATIPSRQISWMYIWHASRNGSVRSLTYRACDVILQGYLVSERGVLLSVRMYSKGRAMQGNENFKK